MGLGQTVRELGGGLAALGVRVSRLATAIPQNADDNLFIIQHGKILLTSLMGEVTVIIAGGANNTNLLHTPTTGLAAQTDLCAVLDINADVVGTQYTIDGTVGNALLDDAGRGEDIASLPVLLILQPGTIAINCAQAAGTGSIEWVLEYVALDQGAKVVVAP